MYADDLVLISKSKGGLQAQLDALNVYCDEWELNINIDKTKIMIISNKSQNDDNMFPYWWKRSRNSQKL